VRVAANDVVVAPRCSELCVTTGTLEGTVVRSGFGETTVVDVDPDEGEPDGTVVVGAGGSEIVGGLHLFGPGGAGTATRRATTAMNTARISPAARVRCT